MPTITRYNIPTIFTLDKETVQGIERLANKNTEGNRSFLIRKLVREELERMKNESVDKK